MKKSGRFRGLPRFRAGVFQAVRLVAKLLPQFRCPPLRPGFLARKFRIERAPFLLPGPRYLNAKKVLRILFA
jgi:hypothetical protein